MLTKRVIPCLDVRNGRAFFYRTTSRDIAFVGHPEGNTPEKKAMTRIRAA